MKLFIKRQMVANTLVDPSATIKLSPLTVLKTLAHHPVKTAPSGPNMADYIALGPTGGTLVAAPLWGIKLIRNGNYLPFTLQYYRITMGARVKVADQDFTMMVQNLKDASDANVFNKMAAIPGEPFPNQEPGTQGRTYTPQEKLIYSNNASKTVLSSEADEQAQGLWPMLSSSNGFPSANGLYRAGITVEPSYQGNGLWDQTAAVTARDGNHFLYEATVCEYYQIDIDDTLIANISSLTNDVFISIPSTFGYHAPYTIPAGTPLGPVNCQIEVPGTIGVLQRPVYAENELVMPLSWVLSQTSQQLAATKNVNGNTSPIRPPFGALAPFSFDLTYNHVATVTTTPAREITLLDPIPFTGTLGPY